MNRIRTLLRPLAVMIFVASPAIAADDGVHGTEAQAVQRALRTLDQAIARYELLVGKIDDPEVGATARAFLASYRERRGALQRSYDATKHDELRFDINVESHRLAQWLAPPRTPPPKDKR